MRSTQQTTFKEARVVIKSDKDINEYNKKELIKAIEYYNRRDRRFGGI